ncbi:MAG: acyltransferase [Methylocapsa sp.]|nr:acyltransferase [Methylocapsa sp.]
MGLFAKLPRLQPASDELLHLDLMRFIASAGIVIHHSHEFFVHAKSPFLVREQTAGLALFVDLFFVISGFIIAYIYHDRVNTAADYIIFLQRRVGRLVPLHWVTLLASIAMWSVFAVLHYSAVTPSFEPQCIAETAFLVHSILPCEQPFNGVTWSLSAEMAMYIAFPLVAIIGSWSARLLSGIGFAALLAMMAAAVSQHEWRFLGSSWIDLSPALRAIPSFVFGAALYYNRQIAARIPGPGFLLAAAISGLIAAMMGGVSQLLILLIVYTVAMAAVAADLQGSPPALVRRLAPLGQLTYSIYMWHLVFILIWMYSIGDVFLYTHSFSAPIIAGACYVNIFIVSYFSFFFIETPARRWIDKLNLIKPAFTNAMPLKTRQREAGEPRCNGAHSEFRKG